MVHRGGSRQQGNRHWALGIGDPYSPHGRVLTHHSPSCLKPNAQCQSSRQRSAPPRPVAGPESMNNPEGRSGRPVSNFIGCGTHHSVVVEGLPPPWVSGTEVAGGNPSPTSGARVAWVRCSPSQAAGRRRIAYVRPPRRSPSPAHQRAFQSSGDGVERSMRVRARSGDKFFAGMVNGMETLVGRRHAGDPQVARVVAHDGGRGVHSDPRLPLTLPSPRTLTLRGEEGEDRAHLTCQGRTVLLPLPACG